VAQSFNRYQNVTPFTGREFVLTSDHLSSQNSMKNTGIKGERERKENKESETEEVIEEV
jgi:hypothetical protein